MRKGLRCWLSVLLAAVLAMGLMPASALADEGETGPVAVTSLAPSPQPEQHPVALDGPSPDELVAGHIEQQFDAALPGEQVVALRRVSARDSLGERDRAACDQLVPRITKVASGESKSAVLAIDVEAVYGKTSWTAEDLGVDSIAVEMDGKFYWNQKARNAFKDQHAIDLKQLLYALMADLPYGPYWFDQQAGVVVTSFSAGLFEGEEEWCIHYPDICDAVKYNFAAAEDDGMPYGDPWRLVCVFDGDDSTDVVCEGHAKAFKYLCDLRGIEGVGCILASGPPHMYGESTGNHMRDVVSMDDGSNYLVDVTNCDEGASGFPDKLFVASAVSGSLDEGHSFEPQERAVMKYVYFDKVRSLFSEEALTLATSPYVSQSDLADAEVTGIERCCRYTGRAIEPEPVVTYDGRVLERDVDYTVSYDRNKCPGKAALTITGIGYYVGERAVTFDIAVGARCAGWASGPGAWPAAATRSCSTGLAGPTARHGRSCAQSTASALALGLAAYRGGLLPLPPCSYYSTA